MKAKMKVSGGHFQYINPQPFVSRPDLVKAVSRLPNGGTFTLCKPVEEESSTLQQLVGKSATEKSVD